MATQVKYENQEKLAEDWDANEKKIEKTFLFGSSSTHYSFLLPQLIAVVIIIIIVVIEIIRREKRTTADAAEKPMEMEAGAQVCQLQHHIIVHE